MNTLYILSHIRILAFNIYIDAHMNIGIGHETTKGTMRGVDGEGVE